MCSIIGIWQKEGKFPLSILKTIFHLSEKRGSDGYGVYIINLTTNKITYKHFSLSPPTDNEIEEIYNNFPLNSLLISNLRAQPETEVSSSLNNLQPIYKNNIIVAHNGAVNDGFYRRYISNPITNIDSEVIIDAYIEFGKDIKQLMETIIGGFAYIMYDFEQRRLYLVNDFKPLYKGYYRGYGLVVGSLPEIFSTITSQLYDGRRTTGMALWEDYYYNRQDGFTIVSIDVDSGIERHYKFTPNYLHPYWKKEDKGRVMYIVLASGGIDSGLTAWVLGKLGYKVLLLHFDYGQKGEEAEHFGITKIYEKMKEEGMDVELMFVDLKTFYNNLNEKSELISEELDVTTGRVDTTKSTVAWVSARNLLFSSYAIAIAESYILQNKVDKVYISAGYFNLTESGVYPDNSEYFGLALDEVVRYGTLTPNRIKFQQTLANVMKSEEWILGKELNFPFEWTVSCDTPKVEDGKIYLCEDCGSTKLSRWAAIMAGVEDPRHFYRRNPSTKHLDYPTKVEFGSKRVKPSEIIYKLNLPDDDKLKLLKMVGE